MKTPSRLVYFVALLCAAVWSPAQAALVDFTGEGVMVGAYGPVPDRFSVELGAETVVTIQAVFDTERAAGEVTEESATYEPLYALGSIDGEGFMLTDTQLTVGRDEQFGIYYYYLRGTTPQGWVIWLHGYSDDPQFVPTLTVPAGPLPVVAGYFKWDVGCRDGEWAWETYSDGAAAAVRPVGGAAGPTIREQPASLQLAAGQNGKLAVKVADPEGVTYQWYQDGRPLPGATSAKWSIKSAGAAQAGNYHVVVTSAAGAATISATALVSVP